MTELGPGEVFAGHRIEGVAGRGGMGVVYRAVDLSLDRPVALKLVAAHVANSQPGFRERFQRESRLAASLHHPNIIPIYQAGEYEGSLFVTMHLVEGSDLQAALAHGPLAPEVALGILRQVAEALDSAHARGLVHRDVKPGNVLLEHAPHGVHVYLSDFGLTKHASSQSGVTATGFFVGTLDYAAPEQFEGNPVDARTDVYALGCMAFHVLTGSIPFPRDSDSAKMYAQVNTPPPPLSDRLPGVPDEVDAAVRRAMAKRPGDRYQSAGDFVRALDAAATGGQVTVAERSVAVGPAAPGTPVDVTAVDAPAPSPVPPLPPAPPPAGPPAGAPQAVTPHPAPPPVAAPGGVPRWLTPVVVGAILLLVVGAVLAASLGGGDGGGSSDTAAPAGATTATEQAEDPAAVRARDEKRYRTRVNRVCRSVGAEQKKVDRSVPATGTIPYPTVANVQRRLASLDASAAKRIAQIKPPDRLATLGGAYVDALRDRAGANRAVSAAAGRQDPDAVARADTKKDRVTVRLRRLGKRLRVKCKAVSEQFGFGKPE